MYVEQIKAEFNPVTVTLQSQEEVDILSTVASYSTRYAKLLSVVDLMDDLAEFLSKITDGMENVCEADLGYTVKTKK